MASGTHSNGIPINIVHKSDYHEAKNMAYTNSSSTDKEDSAGDNCHDDSLSEFERFGKTPPRTRILRRMRERNQKIKETNSSGVKTNIKIIHSNKSIVRRNTVTTLFNEMVTNADDSDSYLSAGSKRTSKRSMKLLRGSERDLKLDITSAMSARVPQPQVQVESSNRFMSLCSRLVACPNRVVKAFPSPTLKKSPDMDGCPQNRMDFYKTFSCLIKMGGGEKQLQERTTRRHASREDTLWQNELKDLIWLELQAWHADRTLTDQDTYIYEARQSVADLLTTIMTYRFQKPSKSSLSIHSSDSGFDTEDGDCSGCLSMYCHPCMDAQLYALHEVEQLMKRLESAEALYPSSKAFAEDYPLYNSPEFVGRVKAMCLWYNMTKNHRLKLIILGRLLFNVQKTCKWPLNLGDDLNFVDSTSPSDSNSSTSSYVSGNDCKKSDNTCISPIMTLYPKDSCVSGVSPYRRYIEEVLKTKGLAQALHFLERLHRNVLCKAQMTLEKPPDDQQDGANQLSPDSELDELRRYGYWSKEYQALGLPSYKSAFLFLTAVPLEVIHEFLRMRLEQKPEKPSPLSVRQLMREFKEGLNIAVVQKERVNLHIQTACTGKCEDTINSFKKSLASYDETLKKVLEVYLEYLEQWALVQSNSDICQKNFLEAEWTALQKTCPFIDDGFNMVVSKLCHIIATILTVIGEDLISRIENVQKPEDTNKKQSLFVLCRELQTMFNEAREKSVKIICFSKTLMKDFVMKDKVQLKESMVGLKHNITQAINKVQVVCDSYTPEVLDDSERAALQARCREVLLQGYRFGFDFHKEMSQFMPGDYRQRHPEMARRFALGMVQFAYLWMEFARDRCERGRGMRPRWAYQGLDFLMAVCEPQNTMHLTNEEFEELKSNMDACISHVIGTTAPNTPESAGAYHGIGPRLSLDYIRNNSRGSRGSSPSPRAPYKSQRSQRKPSTEQSPASDVMDSPDLSLKRKEEPVLVESEVKVKFHPAQRAERVRDAVQNLENQIDTRLFDQDLIGKVITAVPENKCHIRKRIVTFSWQRGIKIGQGRFGKVYTAVNNNTGEMMAMKEIPLQYNDVKTIKKVSEEIRIMEGISHPYLVKYYGIEIHREEMLIFMEFCSEGTLESLVAGTEAGLPEPLVRRYTAQLLSGVNELHNHGIAHRDIKSANIFLTDEGNCLKIGDFGSAVKIKAHTTMPGELQGFVGTQAYMAPEVFMKNSAEGHGRAADIWSVGCVVVEMASGKRPWAEYDSNYQIMFKVGMGERPEIPESMSDEGQDFIDLCLQHNTKDRATAGELLDHNFVKVDDVY